MLNYKQKMQAAYSQTFFILILSYNVHLQKVIILPINMPDATGEEIKNIYSVSGGNNTLSVY